MFAADLIGDVLTSPTRRNNAITPAITEADESWAIVSALNKSIK